MTLGEKLKQIRVEARLSQRALAAELACAQSIISAYELDQKKPSYDQLVRYDALAKKYKVKVKLL